MDKQEVWVRFATAVLATGGVRDASDMSAAAALADRMLEQWALRFGDMAFLLDGQRECAACHKPIPEGEPFLPSVDGVKFCNNACLTASGRES